jgi:Rrf2 family transcriptional regulator, iron-sulfur cluster assembly transcription factor
MLYGKTTEYIIRAMVYLSLQTKGNYINIKDISENTDIPQPFLAKLFQDLAKTKWIDSKKGKNGGVKIIIDTKLLTLYDIVDWSEGMHDLERCIFGNKICGEINKCSLHNKCNNLKSQIMKFFKNTTIKDFSKYWKEHTDIRDSILQAELK